MTLIQLREMSSTHIGPNCICEGRNPACNRCMGTGNVNTGNAGRAVEVGKTAIDPLVRNKRLLKACMAKYDFLQTSIAEVESRKENLKRARYLKNELESLEELITKFRDHIGDFKKQIIDILGKTIKLRTAIQVKYSGLINCRPVNYKLKNAYDKLTSPPAPEIRKLPKAALPPGKKRNQQKRNTKKKKK